MKTENYPTRQTVITFSSSRGLKINLTRMQVKILKTEERWPRDWSGEEYATVSHGKHFGTPSCASDLVDDLMAL